ncbi:unnamed protein product [Chrysoparadoxa australica]
MYVRYCTFVRHCRTPSGCRRSMRACMRIGIATLALFRQSSAFCVAPSMLAKPSKAKKISINPGALASPEGVIQLNIKTGEMTEEKPPAPGPTATPGKLPVGQMELYCKAGATEGSLGDCPFTHYVQMVLHYKKLPFQLSPCTPDSKPQWLVDDYEGKMPCLVHDGEAYTESSEIARYVEYFFPEPSLTNGGDTHLLSPNTVQVTSGLFPALARCIKNTDCAKDPELVGAVVEELKRVDEWLKKSGKYLTGDEISLADCSFAPKLYHAKTTLAHYKNTVISPDLESLGAYMDAIFSHPAFIASSYPPDVVVWGWGKARGG